MAQGDGVYLHHILDAIDRIETYLQGIDEAEFFQTPLIQDGIIRQLEIVGEATKRLSKELRDATSQIPWVDIAGMRDKLIHDYLGVDIGQVWYTAKEDVPELKLEVVKVLKTFE
jgi:uncharacterized protein with HEPN domain